MDVNPNSLFCVIGLVQHVVRAPKDGTLAEIRAGVGQQVQDGARLFRLQ